MSKKILLLFMIFLMVALGIRRTYNSNSKYLHAVKHQVKHSTSQNVKQKKESEGLITSYKSGEYSFVENKTTYPIVYKVLYKNVEVPLFQIQAKEFYKEVAKISNKEISQKAILSEIQ